MKKRLIITFFMVLVMAFSVIAADGEDCPEYYSENEDGFCQSDSGEYYFADGAEIPANIPADSEIFCDGGCTFEAGSPFSGYKVYGPINFVQGSIQLHPSEVPIRPGEMETPSGAEITGPGTVSSDGSFKLTGGTYEVPGQYSVTGNAEMAGKPPVLNIEKATVRTPSGALDITNANGVTVSEDGETISGTAGQGNDINGVEFPSGDNFKIRMVVGEDVGRAMEIMDGSASLVNNKAGVPTNYRVSGDGSLELPGGVVVTSGDVRGYGEDQEYGLPSIYHIYEGATFTRGGNSYRLVDGEMYLEDGNLYLGYIDFKPASLIIDIGNDGTADMRIDNGAYDDWRSYSSVFITDDPYQCNDFDNFWSTCVGFSGKDLVVKAISYSDHVYGVNIVLNPKTDPFKTMTINTDYADPNKDLCSGFVDTSDCSFTSLVTIQSGDFYSGGLNTKLLISSPSFDYYGSNTEEIKDLGVTDYTVNERINEEGDYIPKKYSFKPDGQLDCTGCVVLADTGAMATHFFSFVGKAWDWLTGNDVAEPACSTYGTVTPTQMSDEEGDYSDCYHKCIEEQARLSCDEGDAYCIDVEIQSDKNMRYCQRQCANDNEEE